MRERVSQHFPFTGFGTVTKLSHWPRASLLNKVITEEATFFFFFHAPVKVFLDISARFKHNRNFCSAKSQSPLFGSDRPPATGPNFLVFFFVVCFPCAGGDTHKLAMHNIRGHPHNFHVEILDSLLFPPCSKSTGVNDASECCFNKSWRSAFGVVAVAQCHVER